MLDSAFIATERRFLLVSDTLREIELAKLGNGECCLVARSSLGRVTTIGDLPEEPLRLTSGRFRRPRRRSDSKPFKSIQSLDKCVTES